jgi:ABC-2 type transport system ATP-binding protein
MRSGALVADTTPDELLATTGAPDAERAFLALIDAAGVGETTGETAR